MAIALLSNKQETLKKVDERDCAIDRLRAALVAPALPSRMAVADDAYRIAREAAAVLFQQQRAETQKLDNHATERAAYTEIRRLTPLLAAAEERARDQLRKVGDARELCAGRIEALVAPYAPEISGLMLELLDQLDRLAEPLDELEHHCRRTGAAMPRLVSRAPAMAVLIRQLRALVGGQ